MTAQRGVAMRRASGFDAGMDALLKATRYMVTDVGTHNEYPERDHQVFMICIYAFQMVLVGNYSLDTEDCLS